MKNNFEILGDKTVIFLRRKNGDVIKTFIATADLPRVQDFPNSWYAKWDSKCSSFYVHGHLPVVEGKKKTTQLHRWIMNPPNGLVIDHINHNTLDNRRSNLRIVTDAQNRQNLRACKSNISGVCGVCWHKQRRKWRVQIKIEGKRTHLGYFTSLSDAEIVAKNARAKFLPYSQEAFQINGGI